MVEVEERAEDHDGPSEIIAWPQTPVYNLAASPRELSRINVSELQSEVRDNFCRHARWCADGSSVLTISEDRIIRVFDTPTSSDNVAGPSVSSPRTFAQPDAIHATAWFPSATVLASETFCFAASIRDTPVRLVDATDGRIRATYPIIDHRERMIAPHSLAWNPTATKLYCGHESAIEVLDIASPGEAGERWKTSYTRKEKGNQKGIISTLAFCPDYSGLFAAGSFAGNVSLYSEDTGSTAVAHLEGIKGGGVTQVAFHPLSPQTLFVASRRCNVIQVFDTRNPSSGPFMEIERKGMSNQRIWFDVDPWGRYLASGDEVNIIPALHSYEVADT
ncbi:hypothetical protein BCR39DRAFT_537048 [Naematelia encephala]|uniref:WD40-repeat-containing domain protein n=1 Tax=Naematelia encephala TaxID=71784 RepID=A0A1Y2AYV4_9TREE|nr:hypothetical protein BCR39DRAFT_537048 [Naematelia encephala]